ncbi:hypothetical protein PCE1_003628 [Barthelona sp. PCE]
MFSKVEQVASIGKDGVAQLMQASVLVIGAGGIGTPVLLGLAGAGVSNITIVDFDVVDPTNIHRQFFYRQSDIDREKARVAAQFLEERFPNVHIVVHNVAFNEESVDEVMNPGFSLMLDCSDNWDTRDFCNTVSLERGVPLLHCGVAANDGQCCLLNYDENAPCYRCLTGKKPSIVRNAAKEGITTHICMLVGAKSAGLAIDFLLGRTDNYCYHFGDGRPPVRSFRVVRKRRCALHDAS